MMKTTSLWLVIFSICRYSSSTSSCNKLKDNEKSIAEPGKPRLRDSYSCIKALVCLRSVRVDIFEGNLTSFIIQRHTLLSFAKSALIIDST